MQKSLLKNKWIKLFTVSILCAVLVYFGTSTVLAITANDDIEEKSVIFSVDVPDEDGEIETYYYDVTTTESRIDVYDGEAVEVGSAVDYLDSYGQNLQHDANSKANIDTALKTTRGDVKNYGTIWALVPPVVAIILALITKEVYSSLFVGILFGGLIYSNFSF